MKRKQISESVDVLSLIATEHTTRFRMEIYKKQISAASHRDHTTKAIEAIVKTSDPHRLAREILKYGMGDDVSVIPACKGRNAKVIIFKRTILSER